MERPHQGSRSNFYRVREIIRFNERQTDSTSSESDVDESSSYSSEAMGKNKNFVIS